MFFQLNQILFPKEKEVYCKTEREVVQQEFIFVLENLRGTDRTFNIRTRQEMPVLLWNGKNDNEKVSYKKV